ncbi:hypothetical protein [Haloferax sp. DFSO60]|uniref:hypothetical protein n=1 Tax=Haloferax sp. DFSO60 TaxID=3388652 RepID=UPI00397DF0FB
MQPKGTIKTTIVGKPDPSGPGVFDCDAAVVLVRAKRLNIWVGRRHFVSDPDGYIERGQHVLVMRADGGSVSRITRPTPVGDEDSIQVEHLVAWDDDGLIGDPAAELWPRGVLDGTVSDFFGEGVSVRFIRPTTR